MPVWTLAFKDLRLLARDRRSVVILLAMPVVVILVLGMALGETFGQKPDDRLRVSVVVEDRGLPANSGPFPGESWANVVLRDLNQTAGIRVEPLDRPTAERLVRRGQRACVLVFGPDFSDRVHRCSFLNDRITPTGINPFFRDGVKLETLGVEVQEEHPGLIQRGAQRYQILVPSYTVMFAFFLVLTVGWLFVAERRQGTMLRLRAAPLTRGQILMGKLLPCFALSLFQGFFLLIAGKLVFGMSWGTEPWALVPVVV